MWKLCYTLHTVFFFFDTHHSGWCECATNPGTPYTVEYLYHQVMFAQTHKKNFSWGKRSLVLREVTLVEPHLMTNPNLKCTQHYSIVPTPPSDLTIKKRHFMQVLKLWGLQIVLGREERKLGLTLFDTHSSFTQFYLKVIRVLLTQVDRATEVKTGTQSNGLKIPTMSVLWPTRCRQSQSVGGEKGHHGLRTGKISWIIVTTYSKACKIKGSTKFF